MMETDDGIKHLRNLLEEAEALCRKLRLAIAANESMRLAARTELRELQKRSRLILLTADNKTPIDNP